MRRRVARATNFRTQNKDSGTIALIFRLPSALDSIRCLSGDGGHGGEGVMRYGWGFRMAMAGTAVIGLLMTGAGTWAHGRTRATRDVGTPRVYRFLLAERIVEAWTGAASGGHTFTITAAVAETVAKAAADGQHLVLRLSAVHVHESGRWQTVAPFQVSAWLQGNRLVRDQVLGFRSASATFRAAMPPLARTLAYVLQGRPRTGGARWSEVESFWYRGVPVTLPVTFMGRPVARLSGSASIPSHPETMSGYAVTVGGHVNEEGVLVLGATGDPPATYRAVTVVAVVAQYGTLTVGQDTVTVTVNVVRSNPRTVR
jgi:hypothetical protein